MLRAEPQARLLGSKSPSRGASRTPPTKVLTTALQSHGVGAGEGREAPPSGKGMTGFNRTALLFRIYSQGGPEGC